MKLKAKVSWLMETVQQSLFPHLDECLPLPLTNPEKQLVKILELVQIEKYVPVSASRQWLGRPIKEREALARAFIAKAVQRYQHTSSLRHALLSTPNLRLICGFSKRQEVPSESTFSRAFAEFAKVGLGTLAHDALVSEHLGSELIGHISRDSTAITGREKPAKKVKAPKVAKKKGRPAKGEIRPPAEPKRLDQQCTQTAEEAIAQLPNVCDRGVKKNAKGYTETWNGFKLHLDVNDCGFPLSAVLTSASVHDSQVAIPLMKLTASKVTSCYDLMDAAYDASQIWEQSRELGHVPIIDRNPRGQEVIPMAPHEAIRYNERTAAERCNGRLKDEFGGRSVQVRGADKVMLHLMFGVTALFADQLLKVTGC
ncbi:transposase [Malonomonas rubra]|uniref:transposase n=1 Tax=Malonomonas rubra TaxID=57040 RepID=UPI0026E9A99F|nr:transposase [Malonomonas rubra]